MIISYPFTRADLIWATVMSYGRVTFFSSFSSFLQKKDVERTIGIDTDYIETNDFNLEPADKLFLIEVRPL